MNTTKFLILTNDVDHDGCSDEQYERIRSYDCEYMVFIECVHSEMDDNCIDINGNTYVRDVKGFLYYMCGWLTKDDVVKGFERKSETKS